MPTILVVESEQDFLDTIVNVLRDNSYQIITAATGTEALKVAFQTQPDLAIIDVLLPGMNGVNVCRRLRELTEIPIIMFSSLTEETVVVEALESGADDYVTKPFGMSEFLARINACLRRAQMGGSPHSNLITVGNIIINLASRKVSVDGEPVELTPTEFNFLTSLAKRRGKVVSHQTLLQEVWGPEYTDQFEYLRIYARHLRSKIEADPSEPRLLLNKHGVGYCLAA